MGTECKLQKSETMREKVMPYISSGLIILTAPLIYAMVIPAVLLDFFVFLYHSICFPVYGIEKVERGDYIIIDRHKIARLNGIQKLNCVYCGYFNGLIAYVQEIAGRTELYWCPLKHEKSPKKTHDLYQKFENYPKS